MLTRLRTSVLILVLIVIASTLTLIPLEAGPLAQRQIPDARGGVNCVVTVPPVSGALRSADPITVDIRVPATPEAALLSKLPPQRRDYSGLPIAVYLVPAPPKGETVSGRPPIMLPLSKDPTPRRLGVALDADLDTFIRVVFQRGGLKAHFDIVAERTALADSGEKVTTQTRCRISPADAAVWR